MLDVQEPPKWVIKPFDVEGVESDKVEFKCQALGHPVPRYSWVNWEGIDARQKEGLCFLVPDDLINVPHNIRSEG